MRLLQDHSHRPATQNDEARLTLLTNIMETYLELNDAEQAGFEKLVAALEGKEVEMEVSVYEQRGIEKGIAKGIEQGVEMMSIVDTSTNNQFTTEPTYPPPPHGPPPHPYPSQTDTVTGF